MKQKGILFISFFLITATAFGQDTKPKLDSLLEVLNSLEQEIKVIDKKVSELKNEINRLSGTKRPSKKSSSSSGDARFSELVEKYGESDASMIINKSYRVGMTKEMLLESIGSPTTQSATKMGSTLLEELRYETIRKHITFTFHDGFLDSFHEY